MGIKYICDECGKEYDIRGGFSPIGYPAVAESLPDKWAVISYLAPEEPVPQPESKPGLVGIPVGRMPKGFLVCSQPCAEKALDEVKELLRLAFEKVS